MAERDDDSDDRRAFQSGSRTPSDLRARRAVVGVVPMAVVVAGAEHLVAAADEVTLDDLTDEQLDAPIEVVVDGNVEIGGGEARVTGAVDEIARASSGLLDAEDGALTGTLSSFHTAKVARPQAPLLSLEPTERARLHARIAERFDAMIEAGLVGEDPEPKSLGGKDVGGVVGHQHPDRAGGAAVALDVRARARRDQVMAAKRATEAANTIFSLAGGRGLSLKSPVQRLWRDALVWCRGGCRRRRHRRSR